MIQGVEQIPQAVNGNTAVIVLLGIFISEKVISMVIKGVQSLRTNGNGKRNDDTQRLPCLSDPSFTHSWELHKQEAHDTKLCSDRMELGLSKLLKESLIQTNGQSVQTSEIKKQTRILEKIQRNGKTE